MAARGAAQHPHSAQDSPPENGQPQMSTVPKLNPTIIPLVLHQQELEEEGFERGGTRNHVQGFVCAPIFVGTGKGTLAFKLWSQTAWVQN